jgi:hypothetical protein
MSVRLCCALLLACGDDEVVDTSPAPFQVVGIDPVDGATMESPIGGVQLILSEDPDLTTCDADTVRIDALTDEGAVAFPVATTFELSGEGNLRVMPVEPYFSTYTYAVTIRGGAAGCLSVSGREILPFHSTFEVP